MRLYNQLQGGSIDSLDEIKENINEEIRTENEQNMEIKLNRIIDIDNNIVESEDDLGGINNNCRNHNVKISERGRGRGGAMGSVSSFSEAIRRRLYSSKVSIIWYFIFLFLICTFLSFLSVYLLT